MSFTVTYSANGATTGTVPVDPTAYSSGDTVTILGNTGGLDVPDGQFAYWNTAADGTGTLDSPGGKFTITGNVTLFAQWLITDGLPNGGVTTHYKFSYDSVLKKTAANPGGVEPARTTAVMAAAEDDFALMSSWFGGIDISLSLPVETHVINAGGGAAWGPPLTLKPGNGDEGYVRYLMVAEVVEMLMDSQGKGWFAPDGSNEQSCGEALSRFLSQQFLVLKGLGIAEGGYDEAGYWLNSSLPPGTAGSSQLGPVKTTLAAAVDAVTTTITYADKYPIPKFGSSWIIQVENEQMLMTATDGSQKVATVQRGYAGTTAASHASGTNVQDNFGARADYVNLTLEYDHGLDATIGCATLFIYYLHVQLGFAISDIVQAAPGSSHASNCLRGVYQNLTGDGSDPFPFFKSLLDAAFPSNLPSAVPGPNPDNPWPLGSLTLWGVKDTWGKDEVADIVDHSGGVYPDAFWLVLEGFNKQVAGGATPSTPAVAHGGVTTTLGPSGIAYETSNQYVPQRIRYPYDVHFTSSVAFPPSGETPAAVTSTINILGAPFQADGEFFFLAGADPYFTNVLPDPDPAKENAPYLSEDLRVFTATPSLNGTPVPGGPTFGGDTTADAYSYVQALVGYLNANFADGSPGSPDPFDPHQNVIPAQANALTGDSSVTPFTLHNGVRHTNYNVAIARVRLRGTQGGPSATTATGVKVFFRLWETQTADTDWNPSWTYLSHNGPSGNPQWPLAPSDNHTIPFFATSNAPNFADPDNPEYGSSGVNNQTITVSAGDPQWAYFGCFLNVYDEGFVVNGTAVPAALVGTHHCLVAQIAYDGAPIENAGGVTISPENSDQLAQRNLQVTASDNPGPAASHRVPQTFDVRPTAALLEREGLGRPDELMIDWGAVPVGSTARIYWPGADAAEVLALASGMYGTQSLSAVGAHTIQVTTVDGVTYVPLPFGTQVGLAGLFTVDLPTTVRRGQEFDVVVRRLGSRLLRRPRTVPTRVAIPARPAEPPVPATRSRSRGGGGTSSAITQDETRIDVNPPAEATPAEAKPTPTTVVERYTVGSFRVKIPVGTPHLLLPAEEDTLAILKARLDTRPTTDRWYPVLKKYVEYVAGRVDGLGGDSGAIPPSFGGAPLGGGKTAPGTGHGGEGGGRREEWECTGKVTGLLFDHFGDFEGFILDTGRREYRFVSRERHVRDLAEIAWRERLRLTVVAERPEPGDEVRRIGAVLLREPPAGLRP